MKKDTMTALVAAVLALSCAPSGKALGATFEDLKASLSEPPCGPGCGVPGARDLKPSLPEAKGVPVGQADPLALLAQEAPDKKTPYEKLVALFEASKGSVPAFARRFAKPSGQDERPLRPKTLRCASNGVGPVGRFTLEEFDTRSPWSGELDARTGDGIEVEQTEVAVSFCVNNGCDNNYCFVFLTDELDWLARGKIQEARGLVNYSDAWLSSHEPPQTILVSCGAGG